MKKYSLSDQDKEEIGRLSRDRVGIGTLERYTGSEAALFQPYILLTNFKKYLDHFAETFGEQIFHGSVMRACHAPKERMSIIDIGVGSPTAALIIDLLAFIKPYTVLMLGMCGGLRDDYAVGDFFNPVAAIRDEGTSNFYMPQQCPSLSSFLIQRHVCRELEERGLKYHSGVIHTTNVRFWEFDPEFRNILKTERVQAIDMECATLFTVGYARQVAVGALMLISDLPFMKDGVKTKEAASQIFKKFTALHIEIGLAVVKRMQKKKVDIFGYQLSADV